MKNILFISYGGGHVNLLLPVFRYLMLDKSCHCEFLALTTAGAMNGSLKEKSFDTIALGEAYKMGASQIWFYKVA